VYGVLISGEADRRPVPKENPDILNGGDQEVLDFLPDQSSPPAAFEVMIVGGVGERSFHQVFSSAAIDLGGQAVRLPSGSV
jgi:hypothetical protein